MKIIKLQAENIKRLKAVEITPEGNTVFISGRNGQGKTSVLDSIWFALGGGKATEGTVRPIRDGEERASVTLNLGDMVVTRTWTGNEKTYLKVENKDGAAFKSPQKLLDNLVGRLSFDPLAFTNMDSKTQLKQLLELVELPFDPDEMEEHKKKLYDKRTFVNREVKQLEGQLLGMSKPSPDTPLEEMSASDVLEEINLAQEQMAVNDSRRRELESAHMQYKDCQKTIGSYDKKIKELEIQLAELSKKRDDAKSELGTIAERGRVLKKEVDTLVDPDLSTYKDKLKNIENINTAVRNAKEYLKVKTILDDKKKESEELTKQIGLCDTEKEQALKAAKFPIDGLAFDESGVTFNNIPFKQCSAAERLKVSLAMAMALNPKLRVIRITDASLLDKESMELVQGMAAENDYQVWLEVVDETGSVGVCIEDGEVVNA